MSLFLFSYINLFSFSSALFQFSSGQTNRKTDLLTHRFTRTALHKIADAQRVIHDAWKTDIGI